METPKGRWYALARTAPLFPPSGPFSGLHSAPGQGLALTKAAPLTLPHTGLRTIVGVKEGLGLLFSLFYR